MICKGLRVAVAAGMLVACGVAKAQGNVGTLACSTNTSQPAASSQTTWKVSYFSVGVTSSTNIGSQTGGAGAGKVTFQPFTFHTSLGNFEGLLQLTEAATSFQQCVLSTTGADGSALSITLKLVAPQSATAVGGDGDPASALRETGFTEVTMLFGSIQVSTPAKGNSGGSAGGWNRVTNSSN